MASGVWAFEADRGLGAHGRAVNGHLQRLVISALGQGYCRRGQLLGSLARGQPDMLHRCARRDGKARVRDGLRLMRSVCFDERDFGLFANADRMLERIQRGLVIRGYENQMDGLFEPSFRRNSEDRSIGGE